MMLVECLEQKKMSMYRLAQSSGIPYATVHDICSGKTHMHLAWEQEVCLWRNRSQM